MTWEIKHNTANQVVDLTAPALDVRKFSVVVGDGVSERAEVRHGLDSMDIIVTVFDLAEEGDPWIARNDVRITKVDPNTVIVENTYFVLAECGCCQRVTKPIPKDGWRILVME